MTKPERRHQAATAKSKAERRLKINKVPDISPGMVGKNAAQHGTCACWMCTMKKKPEYRQAMTDLIRLHGKEAV